MLTTRCASRKSRLLPLLACSLMRSYPAIHSPSSHAKVLPLLADGCLPDCPSQPCGLRVATIPAGGRDVNGRNCSCGSRNRGARDCGMGVLSKGALPEAPFPFRTGIRTSIPAVWWCRQGGARPGGPPEAYGEDQDPRALR